MSSSPSKLLLIDFFQGDLKNQRFHKFLNQNDGPVCKALLLSDLQDLKPKDLLDGSPPIQRPLLKVIIQRHLNKYFQPPLLRPNAIDLFSMASTSSSVPNSYQLFLSGRVAPFGMPSSLLGSAICTIDHLIDKKFENFKLMKLLDLSNSNLTDLDLTYVTQCVDQWKNESQLSILILDQNRFSEGVHHIEKLIESDLTVSICFTPMASTEQKKWLNSLSNDLLCHLIWIPEKWLEAGNWKFLISDDEKHSIISQTHQKFFESMEMYKKLPCCQLN